MIAGKVFQLVLGDLLNLRRLCQAIQLAKHNGDDEDMKKLIDLFDIIL